MVECARCVVSSIVMVHAIMAEQLGYLRVYIYPRAAVTAILQKRGYIPPKRRASKNTVLVVFCNPPSFTASRVKNNLHNAARLWQTRITPDRTR